ncbi:hypothetical protein BASA81_002525 [Batrachochytrium salamandrivorans]|nr:hypothetical protein BASA81_002525 [Batrachochytrium salamandrivorans]
MDHHEYLAKRQTAAPESRKQVFELAKQMENEDREWFSRAREGWEVLDRQDLCAHPHRSLIPLYAGEGGEALSSHVGVEPALALDADRNARVFPLNKTSRDELTGTLSVVPTLGEFKTTFLDVFCEGQLRYLDWNNVFAAGGGVLACAQPCPKEHNDSLTAKRNYFHNVAYSSSDVDLFLYGLNEAEAKRKLQDIYQAVSESCPHTVVCFRSAHAVTLVSQFPFRHIQIVLRLYSSPYEILAGFDVDACTIGFDGKQVYADVRAHHALVTRKNTIDVSRRSPSYEMRLAKYGVRGFEVEVADLERDCVDPGIYERPWNSLDGLAKLLVLERLRTPEQRSRFFEMQKLNRSGGDVGMSFHSHRHVVYDSVTQERIEEKLGGTAEVSNYSTVFLAWGPNESCEKTMRLMATKDFKLNGSWFARDRAYRLHPCFFGTMEEVLLDCSPEDPPFPARTEGEDAKLREHRDTYVRGKLTFISDDPGRQRIGSFHPLSETGWAEGVYFHESTEELFSATNADDPVRVKAALGFCVKGPDVRDFFGRTALHLALMAGSFRALQVLLDAGASPLEPMAGGKTPFHLCAMYGASKEVVVALRDAAEQVMLKKLAQKEAEGKGEGKDEGKAAAEPADEFVLVGDDAMDVVGAAVAGEPKNLKKTKAAVRNAIRAADGDSNTSALQLAILLGHLHTARALLECGATFYSDENSTTPVKAVNPVQLLSDSLLDEGIKLFMEFGFKASFASKATNYQTTLHSLCAGSDDVALAAVMRLDPTALDAVCELDYQSLTPLHHCFTSASLECAELLLATGKTVTIVTEGMCQEARTKHPTRYVSTNGLPCFFPIFATVFTQLHNMITAAYTTPEARAELDSRVKLLLRVAKMADPKYKFNTQHARIYIGGHQFQDEYWVQFKKHDRTNYQQPLLVNAAELVSFWVGKLFNLLDVAQAASAGTTKTFDQVDQATFFAVCQEVESKLEGHFAQPIVRGYRLQSQHAYNTSAQDPFKGMDSLLRQYHEKQKLKREALLKTSREDLQRYLGQIQDEFNTSQPIVDFYRSYSTAVGHMALNPYSFRGAFAAQQARQAAINTGVAFTQASQLFFQNMPEEEDIREFLLLSEKRYPVPVEATVEAVPVEAAQRMSTEPWAVAVMQRRLFELCARSFVPLSSANQLNHSFSFELNISTINSGAALLPVALQENIALMFTLCRKPGFSDFAKLRELALLSPVAAADQEGNTLLTMAILANNLPLVDELVLLMHKQVFKPKKAKRTGPLSDRIDNFALMEEMEDMDSENDIVNEEEDDDEDDDEDEEEEGNEDDEEGGGAPKPQTPVAVMKPHESMAKPEQFFGLMSRVVLEDLEWTKKLDAVRATELKRLGHVGVASTPQLTKTALTVTPLQLAIVLGDVPLVSALLAHAKKISPMLLRAICNHEVNTGTTMRYGNYYSHRNTASYSFYNAFDLAVGLDRPDILQVLVREGGIGLDFSEGIERTLNLCAEGSQPWSFYLVKDEAVVAAQAAAAEAAAAKRTKRRAMKHYTGLVSSLYGATKKRNAMKRDPILARIDLMPNPQSTLLILAARFGSVECYQALREPQGTVFDAIVHFLAQDEAKCVRKLIDKARERTPNLFAKMGFGTPGASTVENDALLVMRNLVGGNETLADRNNLTPLHHMVTSETLEAFIPVLRSPATQNDYTVFSLRTQVLFPKETQATLGSSARGASPLSLACEFGLLKEIELLLQLGFNPNLPDVHTYGMNAFHLSLHHRQWRSAKLVASKMLSSKLLEANEMGITPLMSAAQSGTVQALLAIVASCPSATAMELVPGSVNEINADGFSSLHFAANVRYSETLRRLIDWSTQQQPGMLVREEFASSRTPLESSLAVLLQNEPATFSSHRIKRFKTTPVKEEEQDEDPSIPAEVHRLNREEREYVDKEGMDAFATFTLLRDQTKGQKRIRAQFKDVRPARERRMEAVSGFDSGTDLERLRLDFLHVWGDIDSSDPSVDPDKTISTTKERIDRRVITALFNHTNLQPKQQVF